ncbi:ATP-binding protein [Thetidibacter halocola]|uniref:histidine kinase n=1 Tax=Thetidibacter halocola TaxID=2827239 RepID=A0A8J8B953_9RHOB|nr:ATP-binding protein [Thetidibacter halocola]MBS0123843.1 response regulator [Thetidibacter halocola]
MWRRFRENARAARALAAICLAAALAFAVVVQERAQAQAKERAIFAVNAISWKVSELIFEAQRLSSGLRDHEAGLLSRDEVNLRFDLLWSRMSILSESELAPDPTFAQVIAAFRDFLAIEEPVIYTAPSISPTEVDRLALRLDDMVRDARITWIDMFAARQADQRRVALSALQRPSILHEVVLAILIAALMAYVLGEVYFAGVAQRRERSLREQAAQASAAKTRFLANVSHEIRTPLNGILGMASELAETDLTREQADCLSVIEQSGGLLLSTINDVLDLSRIEAGQLHVETRPFVLRDVLSAARALYGARAREKGLSLDLEIDESLPEVVLGDGRRLRQVLHNLIANAVKFTETGGVRVRAGPTPAGEALWITVTDTGPGIPAEAQERVFQPFHQADAGVTRKHGGTGLGLTISRQLCEAMGGTLDLESAVGQGAVFHVTLPLNAASQDQAAAVSSRLDRAPILVGMRILVVDDTATNRLLMRRFLEPTQAQLAFAEDGQEAVDRARARRFDVILMDIQMPRMDGMAATEAIRWQQAESGQAPSLIVAVTANVLAHQIEEYMTAGMHDFLPKPVSKRALFRLLARYARAEAA